MSQVTVTLNGKPREVPDGLSLLDLLEQLDVQPSRVVVEHNREIRRRDDFDKTQVHAGDELELVYFVGGGAGDDALVVAGRSLRSRLIHGTGKFASNEVLARCLTAAQPDMITVAIRRLNLEGGRSELEGIDLRRYTLLPNTAGATTAEGARCLEIGAAAVLVNTAIARAQNPPEMARAFAEAVVAGRRAFKAGRAHIGLKAVASSPVEGLPV